MEGRRLCYLSTRFATDRTFERSRRYYWVARWRRLDGQQRIDSVSLQRDSSEAIIGRLDRHHVKYSGCRGNLGWLGTSLFEWLGIFTSSGKRFGGGNNRYFDR